MLKSFFRFWFSFLSMAGLSGGFWGCKMNSTTSTKGFVDREPPQVSARKALLKAIVDEAKLIEV